MDHSILIRPQRKQLRWRSHDYAADATYFVTVCTLDRECLFGAVTDGVVRRTVVGDVVDACWRAIPDHFPEVTLDAWVTMPNHLHGILTIGEVLTFTVGAAHGRPEHAHGRPEHGHGRPQGGDGGADRDYPHRPLGTIIRLFKSAAMKRINEIQNTPGASLWQRGYHDRVLRDAADLAHYRKYIANNPVGWPTDEENPAR